MTNTHQHIFIPSEVEHYDRCLSCGTLKRTDVVDQDELYKTGYWDREGYSNLEEQVYNLTEVRNDQDQTKVSAVMEYAKGGKTALEIGCSPGSLLKELCGIYDEVVGIEYDDRYESRIRAICGDKPELVFEAFPKCVNGALRPDAEFDFICALDVLEHSDDPEEFLTTIHELLSPNGAAVLMGPFRLQDNLFRESDFHIEHRYLLSEVYLREFLEPLFEEVTFSRFIVGHEIVVVKRPRY